MKKIDCSIIGGVHTIHKEIGPFLHWRVNVQHFQYLLRSVNELSGVSELTGRGRDENATNNEGSQAPAPGKKI